MTGRASLMEVEVKVALGPLEPVVRSLEELGASLVHPRSLEDNVLFDQAQEPLWARGAILRVRTYGDRAWMTYKEPAPGPAGFKVRREVETLVSDSGRCLVILESIGFRKVWRYMKYRTAYRFEDLQILVDETPIGNYLELEGAQEEIDGFASRMGRSPSDYIVESYRALHQRWCRDRGLDAGDMLFGLESRP